VFCKTECLTGPLQTDRQEGRLSVTLNASRNVYERENEGVVIDIQQVPDPRIADLRRAGKIRVALYPPQYAKDLATGELRGWTIELARALAARIGVEFMPIEYQTPPRAMEGLKAGACDIWDLGRWMNLGSRRWISHPRSFNLILPIW
jgi:ABC-type amino acid transport substrate-binding protein